MPSVSLRTTARDKVSAPAAATMQIPATTVSLLLPETGFLRQAQVLVFVPFSKSTLWRRIQAKTFPQPIKLSERVTAWRAEDIRRWITEQGG
jgi:Predicted transcriptional regulator